MDRRDTIKRMSGYCIAIMGATGIDDRAADGRDNAPPTPDNEGAGVGGVLKSVDADGCFAGRLDARGFSRGSFDLLTGARGTRGGNGNGVPCAVSNACVWKGGKWG